MSVILAGKIVSKRRRVKKGWFRKEKVGGDERDIEKEKEWGKKIRGGMSKNNMEEKWRKKKKTETSIKKRRKKRSNISKERKRKDEGKKGIRINRVEERRNWTSTGRTIDWSRKKTKERIKRKKLNKKGKKEIK